MAILALLALALKAHANTYRVTRSDGLGGTCASINCSDLFSGCGENIQLVTSSDVCNCLGTVAPDLPTLGGLGGGEISSGTGACDADFFPGSEDA